MIKKILISQPQPSAKSPYFDIEKAQGVEMVFRPFFKVEGITAKEFRQQKSMATLDRIKNVTSSSMDSVSMVVLEFEDGVNMDTVSVDIQQKINILDYSAVVFTSRHAVDNYFKLAKEMRITIPEDMKYFCVIETIALYIQKYVQYRKRKVFFGKTGKIADLIPTMVKHKVENYLVPQSSVHNDSLTMLLDEKGLKHRECVMYRTVNNELTEEEVKNFDYDMVVFFSPTGVQSFTSSMPQFEQGDVRIAAFGPATAKVIRDSGLRLDLEAPTKEFPSMTAAVENYLKRENRVQQ